MSLLSKLKPNGKNGFGYGSTAEMVTAGISLVGKTILVTGCNSGLGFETMRVLALRGAHIIGTARTAAKAMAATRLVQGLTTPLACELADPQSVRACIASIKEKGIRLDAIIANAGIMALPKLETAFGYELQFFTNHVGHFILVTGLLDTLTDNARVVILSSSAHQRAPQQGIQFDNLDGSKGYEAWAFYGQSKIANLLFAKELSRRFAATGKTANACHPGVIKTNLGRNINPLITNTIGPIANALLFKTIPEGAATQCYAAVNPGAIGISGAYFADCNVAECRADANDSALAKKLWERTEEIVASLKI
ncbi:MAG: oxidoreductase [Verrucomicrobiaceae bacterium]|nr:oxidoreductase [Verrucomicrobiaceae bacterium]